MPVYQRHYTKYQGVYFIDGIGANGKPERIYYILYRRNGKKHEEKAGRQFKDDMTPARAAQIRYAKINGDRVPNTVKREMATDTPATIGDIWAEYRTAKAHTKRIRDAEYMYKKHLEPQFSTVIPGNLELRDFDSIRSREELKTAAPQTIRHIMALLVRIINFGADRRRCEPLKFKPQYPQFDNRVTEDLTAEQIAALLNAAEMYGNPHVLALFRLALYTGMRKEELLRLKWTDIDSKRGFITITNPKGITTVTIPLNELAKSAIKDIPRGGSEYLFPGKKGQKRHRTAYQRALTTVRDLAGLPKSFRPLHGLRHVYASWLASSGEVPMHVIQALLGHKSERMTARYAHLHNDALKRAAEVSDRLFTPKPKKEENP